MILDEFTHLVNDIKLGFVFENDSHHHPLSYHYHEPSVAPVTVTLSRDPQSNPGAGDLDILHKNCNIVSISLSHIDSGAR